MLNKITPLLQQSNFKLKQSSEQGFTLIESLVGIIVITLVLIAITPPIFIATAVRVQNRRAEQAMQLAQGEIDRTRILVEQGNYTIADLPSVSTSSPSDITNQPAPTSLYKDTKSSNNNCPNLYVTGTQVPDTNALRVDIDGSCTPKFFVQTFRDQGVTVTGSNSQTVLMAFRMGVRVYSTVALRNGALPTNLDIQPAPLKFTNGLGSQQTKPLAVLYTTIARSDANLSLCNYNKYLPPTPSQTPTSQTNPPLSCQ